MTGDEIELGLVPVQQVTQGIALVLGETGVPLRLVIGVGNDAARAGEPELAYSGQ